MTPTVGAATETKGTTLSLENLIQRPIRTLAPSASCFEAAQLMRDEPIGAVGAAAALRAAAERPDAVRAVVSRGGRPDLAGEALARVRAPTLLIVGAYDRTVLALNRQASAALGTTNRLEIVAGATHLFEEPGTLDEAARLATEWFSRYLS